MTYIKSKDEENLEKDLGKSIANMAISHMELMNMMTEFTPKEVEKRKNTMICLPINKDTQINNTFPEKTLTARKDCKDEL